MKYQVLRDAGLTEGESKVYLALIELGASTTGPIINKSGVARSFVPHILEQLIAKGLVSTVTKQKRTQYQAAQPERLLNYIDERKAQLQKNRESVETLLPQLLLLSKHAPKNSVNVFSGFKGLITVHEHTYDKLKRGEEYCYLGVSDKVPGYHHAYWHKDHKRRAAAGIRCRMLFHSDADAEQLRWRNALKGCDARYMQENIRTPAWFLIYADTVVIGMESDPIAIEIVNEGIVASFKQYFEEFWTHSQAPKR